MALQLSHLLLKLNSFLKPLLKIPLFLMKGLSLLLFHPLTIICLLLNESVAVTDLEYDAQSDTERNDAGRVYYEENEPQIVMGSYMCEPEYEVDEQVLAEPEVQQEDLALLQNMDW
ncbi:hypothetical protein GWK47_014626 [Chionoecetes opilio]|uniref:Uncharacterized protein n=1 Tax=Chionoecetes opilio TaxID=41210 RepID=A0A8J4XUJ7_CHIOP|nr:hypothetical protein GWK47_014626 [Chionoecetes opilio]